MGGAQFETILSSAVAVCAVMAVLNVFRFRTRGPAAIALGAAFVSLGFTIWLFKVQAAQGFVIAGILLTVLLIGADFGLRAKYPAEGRKR